MPCSSWTQGEHSKHVDCGPIVENAVSPNFVLVPWNDVVFGVKGTELPV